MPKWEIDFPCKLNINEISSAVIIYMKAASNSKPLNRYIDFGVGAFSQSYYNVLNLISVL